MAATQFDWITAFYASKESGYADVSDPVISNQLYESTNPLDELLEAEKEYLLNKRYLSLSDEAKELIDIIVSSPAEFLETFGFKTVKSANTISIEAELRKRWKDWKYARKVVQEVKEYVRETVC
ncbi:MAG: hypothetical protein WC143_04630 [Eubacteriales bacterium]|jgi:hypothetical protein